MIQRLVRLECLAAESAMKMLAHAVPRMEQQE
jgi:hypothetical protein